MRKSNYPTAQLAQIDGKAYVKETITSLRQLHNKQKPRTEEELRERIDSFFEFCSERSLRPGIEQLALSLGVSRQAFYLWCNGDNCSEEWRRICEGARQFIVAFIEALSLHGHLNPATSCFVLKNWAGYRDAVEIEPVAVMKEKEALPASMLPRLVPDREGNDNK